MSEKIHLKTQNEQRMATRLTKMQQKVSLVFNPDLATGVSNWVHRSDLGDLSWGNNGVSRHGVFFNDNRFVWQKYPHQGKIVKLRTCGYSPDEQRRMARPIREDIRCLFANKACVVCGSTSNVVADHKNDLYNDPRVLNLRTQTVDDFQCLCTHCNLQKREVIKKTKASGVRYGATNIPHLAPFGIDFTEGDGSFDPTDIHAMRGTYWYDPVDFMKSLFKLSIDL